MTAPCATPVNGQPPVGALRDMYFGLPGAMTKLRLPDSGFADSLSRSEVAHSLSSGGTATTRRRKARRAYALAFSQMSIDEADTLISYYTGSRGIGPYALIDPSWRNQLGLDGSTFGVARGSNTVWSLPPARAQPLIDSTVAPALPGSAVLRWVSPVNGDTLYEGTQPSGTLLPSTTGAVPYLNDQSIVGSVYLRLASGTTANVTLYAFGSPAAGWAGSLSATTICALTTSWQRFYVVVANGAWTASLAPYITLGIKATTAGLPNVLLSNAGIQIGPSSPAPWVTGLGVPRVTISSGLSAKSTIYWRRDHGLTLTEV